MGALVANLVLRCGMRVLVLSYTNHALDQFLSDLLKVGISKQYMVRLGSKSTEETAELSLEKQHLGKLRSTMDWAAINSLSSEIDELKESLKEHMQTFASPVSNLDILEWLEFRDMLAFSALSVPRGTLAGQGKKNQYTTVGKHGKKMDGEYLLQRWNLMNDPHPFTDRLQGDTAAF